MKKRKYQRPDFLSEVEQAAYENWLKRKARTHLKRDRNRGNTTSTAEEYRVAIHEAVVRSGGRDAYTGKRLDWSLISRYDNDASKAEGRAYKARFALLPTADHVDDGRGPANFEICSWRVNDAKNDLTHSEFVSLCRAVVGYADGV